MKKKTIALIAHDNKKKDMIAWAKKNKDILAVTPAMMCFWQNR